MEIRSTLVAGLSAAAVVSGIGPAAADNLNGSQLRALLTGKTIYVSAPFGALPIRYNPGGTMVARSRAMGVYSGGTSEDHGTWHISGDQFCQRWTVWHNGAEQCFSVMRTGSTLRWASNDGMTGTAR